jgi:hypothetical protein
MKLILENIYNIGLGDFTILDDIKCLNNDDFFIADHAGIFDENKFKTLLRDRRLLPVIWDNLKQFDFFKTIMVQFCADPQNQELVKSTWLPMPVDLKEAMQGISS